MSFPCTEKVCSNLPPLSKTMCLGLYFIYVLFLNSLTQTQTPIHNISQIHVYIHTRFATESHTCTHRLSLTNTHIHRQRHTQCSLSHTNTQTYLTHICVFIIRHLTCTYCLSCWQDVNTTGVHTAVITSQLVYIWCFISPSEHKQEHDLVVQTCLETTPLLWSDWETAVNLLCLH